MSSAREPQASQGSDALTADGGIVRLRPVWAEDREALAALYERASDDTLYLRFMGAGRAGLPAEVARLTRPPSPDHAAFLAQERGAVIGVGSYERLPQPHEAEFAVFVDDAQHGRGIGTLLVERLAADARRHGIKDLVGEVLPSNAPMLRVATDLTSGLRTRWDRDAVEVRVPTLGADTQALDARERAAERRSLTPLLCPRSVAVAGAGRDPGGIGRVVLGSLRAGGFTGDLYAVNPHAQQIDGVPCYPKASAIPGGVDLIIVAVPAAVVADVLTDSADAGVRAAVVLSSGFGEDGPAGRAAQAQLVRIAREHGIRLVGPNCLGVLNTDPQIRLYGSFAALTPPPGALAVASQSGAVAITVLDHAARTGLGVSSFVSLGNKADVSGNDLLSYWYDDPSTRAVALYLESVGNPRRFARIARAVARRKPVLAVKSGRTAAGSRASASHTAAATTPDATADALFAQAGVIRCDGIGELMDTARLLTGQPLPLGDRLAIVSNAGGINVLAADAADVAGLTMPAVLRSASEDGADFANPVDLGAAASPQTMRSAIRAASAGDADALLVVFAATLANDVSGVLTAVRQELDALTIPTAAVLLGLPDPPTTIGPVPVYPLPEQAISALGHAARYAAWLRAPLGAQPELSGIDPDTARRLVNEALADSHRAVAESGGWQPADVAGDILRCYGLPVVAGRLVADADTAVTAAAGLGYPVVLKAGDPAVVHKTDIGGVRVGLADAGAVRAAYQDICSVTGSPSVLVQPQARGGLELVAGVTHDPLFGSLIMLGLGGVHTAVFADRALRLLPVTDLDAARMWRSLRAAPLLTGYRGAPAIDTAALEDLVLRLGRLAEDLPEVADLDLNPILAGPDGLIAVDVKLRLAPVGVEPDAALRALREPA